MEKEVNKLLIRLMESANVTLSIISLIAILKELREESITNSKESMIVIRMLNKYSGVIEKLDEELDACTIFVELNSYLKLLTDKNPDLKITNEIDEKGLLMIHVFIKECCKKYAQSIKFVFHDAFTSRGIEAWHIKQWMDSEIREANLMSSKSKSPFVKNYSELKHYARYVVLKGGDYFLGSFNEVVDEKGLNEDKLKEIVGEEAVNIWKKWKQGSKDNSGNVNKLKELRQQKKQEQFDEKEKNNEIYYRTLSLMKNQLKGQSKE